jgi:Na+-driven multidrug efflux pump
MNDANFFDTLVILGKLLLVNSLFLIFNNAQLIIILIFVNKKYPNDQILTNSIGVVNLILNILIYPFIYGINSTFEILGSQSFGNKKNKLFMIYIRKLKIIGNSFILVSCLIIYILSKNIFGLWKHESNIQKEALIILIIRFFSLPCEFQISMKLRYLQIINKSSEAILLLISNGILLPLFAYLFILFFDFYSYGCGLVYFCNNIIMLITLIILMNFLKIKEGLFEDFKNNDQNKRNENNKDKEKIQFTELSCNEVFVSKLNRYSNFNEIKNDTNIIDEALILNIDEKDNNVSHIKEEIYSKNTENNELNNNSQNSVEKETNYFFLFKFILPLFLISFMDNLSVESMSIFSNSFDSKSYSIYLNAYSLYNLVGTISISFNTSASILISSNYCKSSGSKMRKLIYNILSIGLIISIFIGTIMFFFCDNILKFLLQNKEIEENSKSMFHMSILCNMMDIIQYILISTLKSFGYIYLSFSIFLTGNITNIILIYFFAYNTQMKIYGIFFGYLMNEIILITMYFFTYLFFIDFEKTNNDNKIK